MSNTLVLLSLSMAYKIHIINKTGLFAILLYHSLYANFNTFPFKNNIHFLPKYAQNYTKEIKFIYLPHLPKKVLVKNKKTRYNKITA